jgi:ketosteroid isomerase-like protein
MHAGDTSIVLQKGEGLLRQKRATGSGHTYGDDLSLCARHIIRVCSVSQPLPAKSRTRISRSESQAILGFRPKGDDIMPSAQPAKEPLEVAMEFINRINAGDVDAICELMTTEHIFQDALGERFIGREKMREGWRRYFETVANYKIRAEEFFQTGDRLAIFGSASGVYAGNGGASGDKFWEVPAAWRAVIRDGLVAEWRVYADNQPLRKLMGERQP